MRLALGVAVVGFGRAGAARVRALEASSRAKLAAVVSRSRPMAVSLEAALADPEVAAVIVCTPNLLHAATTRAALAAGKHVAVEFPLAASAVEARDLLADAAARGRVLHEEHIELLSPSQLALRARARELGPLRSGTVTFSGDSTGWIAEPALAGSAALGALARLHRLVDLFGEAEVRAARLETAGARRRLRSPARLRSRRRREPGRGTRARRPARHRVGARVRARSAHHSAARVARGPVRARPRELPRPHPARRRVLCLGRAGAARPRAGRSDRATPLIGSRA